MSFPMQIIGYCCDIEYHITRSVTSLMAAQANIPPDVPDPNEALTFYKLDAQLNSVILYSLLHGIYTGIIVVTLGNMINMDKSRSTGRAMITTIILLYISTTIAFAFTWSYIHSMLVVHGQTLWTKYILYQNPGVDITIGATTAGVFSTLLADSTMVWRCWVMWGRRWLTVLLPGLLLVSHTVFKIIAISRHYVYPDGYMVEYVLCSSFTLASTLWCTLLIICRIVILVQPSRLGAYRRVIEILVESSALYAISLILFVAFYARNDAIFYYFDVLSAIARGIAPTFLVGRVAAGHARPDESWQGGIIEPSLRFATESRDRHSQQDVMTTLIDDREAQLEINDASGRYMLEGSQEDTANEGVICEDVITERTAAGRFMNESPVRGDDRAADLVTR
ncbi:hypothetical protein EDD18DRAFT_788412 [Armillaria luteobubalina]|uniref:Uncharacterized protein n=1 Tax=Armillaria luteobubalina TaxID=153913 RepID=A0AA39UWV7_9AGAR|nr:hypothetical protein EDD18DRAFT_788412 [Armillaria luteobubalina]